MIENRLIRGAGVRRFAPSGTTLVSPSTWTGTTTTMDSGVWPSKTTSPGVFSIRLRPTPVRPVKLSSYSPASRRILSRADLGSITDHGRSPSTLTKTTNRAWTTNSNATSTTMISSTPSVRLADHSRTGRSNDSSKPTTNTATVRNFRRVYPLLQPRATSHES